MFQKKYIGSFQPEADPPSAEISRFLSEARCQTVPGEAKGSYFRNICFTLPKSRFLSEAKGSYIGIAFNNLGQ